MDSPLFTDRYFVLLRSARPERNQVLRKGAVVLSLLAGLHLPPTDVRGNVPERWEPFFVGDDHPIIVRCNLGVTEKAIEQTGHK